MSNARYNQIIDEVYEKYEQKIISEGYYMLVAIGWPSTKDEFINKCKNDQEFSERWGLKIEERELSLEERDDLKLKLILDYLKKNGIMSSTFEDFKNDEKLIPNIDWRREVWGLIGWIDYGNSIQTSRLEEIYYDIKHISNKQITLTYQNEKIEVYV
jgi:hypothetical protein